MQSWWILLVLTLPATGFSQTNTVTSTQAAQDDDPRLPWRSARWACLAGGSVALILGGLTFAEGLGDEAAIEDADRDPAGVVVGLNQREALRMQDSATRFKSMGAVAMGVGGALLATGIVLWALEPPAPKRQAPVKPEPEVRPFSVIPLLQPGQAGIGLSASF